MKRNLDAKTSSIIGILECADMSALWNEVPPSRDRSEKKRRRVAALQRLYVNLSER